MNLLFGRNDEDFSIFHHTAPQYELQWNLDLTKCQGTGEIGWLSREFIISRFFSIHYTINGLKNIVRYTEDFVTQTFVRTGSFTVADQKLCLLFMKSGDNKTLPGSPYYV